MAYKVDPAHPLLQTLIKLGQLVDITQDYLTGGRSIDAFEGGAEELLKDRDIQEWLTAMRASASFQSKKIR